MSKTQLRKELDLLTKEQLRDLVLDAYTARREIKEYFDFFIDPDVKKLQDKYLTAANRELWRVKRQCTKCRVSVIKKLIKEFASYNPGAEWVVSTQVSIFLTLLNVMSANYYTETVSRYACTLLSEILTTADRAEILDRFLPVLVEKINTLRGADYVKAKLEDILQNFNQMESIMK